MIQPEIAHLAVPISSLRFYARNPRQGDIGAISQSLEHHGQFRPLVVNKRTSEVLAGNHTLAAARALGWEEIAVTYVDVDEAQAAKIVLADNRASDLATQDAHKLAELLQSVGDLAGTLYDGDALDALLADLEGSGPPSLEQLGEEYDEPQESTFWPEIACKVPPPVHARYLELIERAEGTEEHERLACVLRWAEHGAP
jgi:hypothetical protein